MNDLVRTFQNKCQSEWSFQFLQTDFLKSYERAVELGSNRVFLTTYSQAGERKHWTFSEFDRDVRSTRRRLLARFRTLDLIATRDGNTYEHLVHIAAILTGGFQFCPLNPHDSEEKNQAKLALLPKSSVLLESLALPREEGGDEAGLDAEFPLRLRKAQEPFILVFTSGSTGHSKVVQQTEAGILANVEGLIRHHGLEVFGRATTIATPLPVFHVNALEFAFFVSLLSGQRLILFETFDVLQVVRSFFENEIHVFSGVPHLYHSLGQHLQKLIRADFSNFRYFLSAAGPLPLATLEVFAKQNLKIIQGYGLSEAVNFTFTTPIHWSVSEIVEIARKEGRPSVGVPIWGNEAFVLKSDGAQAQEREVGEIAVRGLNVMIGYRGEPKDDPFEGQFLHTGDLGFWLERKPGLERIFFVTGREKDIAKKYGATVSLVELDEIILPLLPVGSDSISVNFEDLRSGEEIAVVCKGLPESFSWDQFHAMLSEKLPPEMRPIAFATTDQSLRTESGKPVRWKFREILRKRLEMEIVRKKYFLLDLSKAGA